MSARLAGGVCALLLLTPSFATATTVGPVTELTASPAGVSQRGPAIAFDPDTQQYVIVWEDGRSPANGSEIFLARIGVDGAIVAADRNGTPVLSPAQPGDQSDPTIAYSPTGQTFVLAWTDPRGGGPDIYAARFFPMGPGTVPEPGGIQLTIGNDAESSPSIACANASCLVAFRSVRVGGGSEILGARILPTGDPLDANPLDLSVGSTARSELSPSVAAFPGLFLVAWEDDRNTMSTGADLFVRTVSDQLSVPANAGSVLVAAPLRQSAVSLTPFGAADVLAAWQDQRAGTATVSDVDVWRTRIDAQLQAVGGGEAVVLRMRNDQIFPSAAGGPNGALVVWEDFRGGAVGLTYGSVLDANAAPKPPSSFPIFSYTSNTIEQVVAKGPGGDYLAAAVRSGPGVSRIVYRLIRDEPPAGTVTGTGTLSVLADGVAAARLSFGRTTGASGLDVVDGTLYTVTLTPPGASLDVIDVDPVTPGHQLQSFDGFVRFGLRSTRPGTVQVALASVEGSATGQVPVVFRNVPPRVSNVRIEPAAPTSSQDIDLLYDFEDVNGDMERGSRIQWTRNTALQPSWNDQRRVPASALSRGDVWRARIQPSDGTDFGGFVFTPDVVILNTPPSAAMVRIEPGADVRTNTELRAMYRFVDPDNDAEMGSTIAWFERGVAQPALANARAVPASRVRKHQSWRFAVVPSDGSNPGPRVESSTVTILNTVPTANAGALGNVIERRVHVLDGSGSSDPDPEDTLAFTWRQLEGGPRVTLMGASTATASFEAPSVTGTTMLEFGLVVGDGEESSTEARVVVLVQPVRDGDADGLDDEEEALIGTDPARADTDRDGLRDGPEVEAGLDPLDADTDDDGVRDGAEPSPLEDSDMDGRVDAADPDSDDDGLFDGTELGVTDPPPDTDLAAGAYVADADRATMTDPRVADTDGDQIPDGTEDANHNGRVDLGESDPNDPTSTVGCAPDRSCPSGLVCERDACRAPPAADGGLMCQPLSAIGVQCCTGACEGGTPVAPLCMMQGERELCPAGSRQCPLSACQAPPPPKDDGGCACVAATSGDGPGAGILAIALMGLATLARRRRRG